MKTNFKELLDMKPLEPSVPGINEEVFAHLIPKISRNWVGFQIQIDDWDSETLQEIQSKAIRPILDLGGYLALGLLILSRRKSTTERHIVLVVGEDNTDILHIKNSWGVPIEKVKFKNTIKLFDPSAKKTQQNVELRPEDLFFMLDVPSKPETFFYGHYYKLYELLASIQPPVEKAETDYLETSFSEIHIAPETLSEEHFGQESMTPPSEGGKKRKTKYGQRRNHHQPKTIRASRKRSKTRHTRRLSKH